MADSSVDVDVDNREEEPPVAALEALKLRRKLPCSAAASGDMAMARASIFSEDDDEDYSKDEKTLLRLVKKGRLRNVKALLETKPYLIMTRTSDGETILHLAAANGDVDTVKHLLRIISHHARRLIRATTTQGDTALHAAAQSGHIDMVKHLVRATTKVLKGEIRGSRTEAPPLFKANHHRNTAVHLALIKGHIEVASYLLKKHPEVAYEVNLNNESPLFLAVKGNHHHLVEDLFKLLPGKDVDESFIKRIARPQTPIVHEALAARNLAMLKVLMENLPSLIKSEDMKGWTPLSYAAYKGYYEELTYFLEMFPKCDDKCDYDGLFPIHKAAYGGHINVLKELLSLRPDSIYQTTKDNHHHTVLHIALRHGKHKAIAYLEKEHAHDLKKILGTKTIEDVLQEVKGKQ